jgi:Xaa-Pro dipeptidase
MVPLRMIKDAEEIAILRRAGEITEAAYSATLEKLQHGMTTLDLVTEVNFQLRKHGSLAPSFVTSFYNMGPTHAFDFHNREAMLLEPLEAPVSISFDFGAVLDGYCYDFGRSVFFGEPDAEYIRVYDLIIASQAAGIAALKAGNTCAQADHVARDVIADAGYGEAFRHRLGHGIGMDVHEPPFLNANDQTVMLEGMCFTVEPSIMVPRRFGARVEDIVVVGVNGGEPLTNARKSLVVI